MIFGQRISESIKENGLKQKELAKKLNIAESNITNWKKGENLPSIEILYKLCIILDESADYLLGLDEKEITKKYINNGTHIGNVKF